jgi:outer membrane protein assembly factor BamB
MGQKRLILLLSMVLATIICSLQLILTLIANEVWGQERRVELETIWEKQFDRPVCDIIFDEFETTVAEAKRMGWKNLEGRKNNERIKIDYPKVVFVADPGKISFRKDETQIKEIRFYNKDGKLIKKVQVETEWLKREKVATSKNGKYIVVYKVPTEDNPENTGGAVYKNDGTLIWKIDKGPSPVIVNDEGYVVAAYLDWGMYASGDYVFYEPSGNELARIKNPIREYTDTGWDGAKFTEDGEYVILGFSAGKSFIILATKDGKILWRKEIDYIDYTLWGDAVKDIGFVGICEQHKPINQVYAYFIDWNGNLRWVTPLEIGGEMKVKILNGQKKVLISSTEGYIWCVDMETGKCIWKHKEEWSPEPNAKFWPNDVPNFWEMKIIKEHICIIGKYMNWTTRRPWYSSTFFIFSTHDGSLIKKVEYPNKRISISTIKDKIFVLDMDNKIIQGLKVEEEK